MAMDPVHDIRPGLEVHTQDGQKLGVVKDIAASAIKIAAPMRPDYWLPRDRVLSYTNDRVTMDFDHDDLDRYAETRPEV